MKKSLLLVAFTLIVAIITAQEPTQKKPQDPITFMGVGLSFFNEDVNESTNTAFHFNMCFWNFYVDFASNLATGKGEELNFRSGQTTKSNKMRVSVINVGYAIRINKVSLIPVLGYGWTMDIYEDPIAFDTYFYDDPKSKFNLGAKAAFDLFGNAGLTAGLGTFEKFNISIWFGL